MKVFEYLVDYQNFNYFAMQNSFNGDFKPSKPSARIYFTFVFLGITLVDDFELGFQQSALYCRCSSACQAINAFKWGTASQSAFDWACYAFAVNYLGGRTSSNKLI